MGRQNPYRSFELDCHSLIHDEVRGELAKESQPENGGPLQPPLEGDAKERQLEAQAIFIGRLRQTGSKQTVNLHGSGDNPARQWVRSFAPFHEKARLGHVAKLAEGGDVADADLSPGQP